MQVFYLERGNYASNLSLETNLIARYPLKYDLKGGSGKGPNQVQNCPAKRTAGRGTA